MRKMKWVFTLLRSCLLISTVGVARADAEPIQGLTIENSTGKYDVTVTHAELGETLEIALLGSGTRTGIAHYTNGGFVYAVPQYPKMDRLITIWEPGVALTIVIFRLAPASSGPEILFENSSEIEPDFIGSSFGGDFMVLYSGKHFVKNSNLWVPENAAIYLWDVRRYRLVRSVAYEKRFAAIAELDKSRGSR